MVISQKILIYQILFTCRNRIRTEIRNVLFGRIRICVFFNIQISACSCREYAENFLLSICIYPDIKDKDNSDPFFKPGSETRLASAGNMPSTLIFSADIISFFAAEGAPNSCMNQAILSSVANPLGFETLGPDPQ